VAEWRPEISAIYFPLVELKHLSGRRDGTATVTINRPDARNALSHDVVVELRAALKEARDDPAVRVVEPLQAGRVPG
jgi:enoyl-CoA hydratase/carnithine racemase